MDLQNLNFLTPHRRWKVDLERRAVLKESSLEIDDGFKTGNDGV